LAIAVCATNLRTEAIILIVDSSAPTQATAIRGLDLLMGYCQTATALACTNGKMHLATFVRSATTKLLVIDVMLASVDIRIVNHFAPMKQIAAITRRL
jgi:hypothetical protein